MRRKLAGQGFALALIAVLALSLAGIARFSDKAIPDNPIQHSTAQIETPTMLVAAQNDLGEGEGEEQQQQEPTEQPQTIQQAQQNQSNGQGTPSDKKEEGSGKNGETPTPAHKPSNNDLAPYTNLGAIENASPLSDADEWVSNGRLRFYFYYKDEAVRQGYSWRVRCTPGGGSKEVTLTSTNGQDYEVDLVPGLDNPTRITVYTYVNGEFKEQRSYQVVYLLDEVDENIKITTNLDGQPQPYETTNDQFTYTVTAVDGSGSSIPASRIRVTYQPHDGSEAEQAVTIASGSDYDLTFAPPNVGDDRLYDLTVTAYDSVGRHNTKSQQVMFHYQQQIGTITLGMDLTAVGLYSSHTFQVDLGRSDSLVDVLKQGFEEQGYTLVFQGDYLARIEGINAGSAAIPDTLLEMITIDGFTPGGPSSSGALQDHDFTPISGWMYSVNGSTPQRSIGSYHVQDGDVITLYFSVAGGKDLGQSSSGQGNLTRYCGIWMRGGYTENHSISEDSYTVYQEPTCTEVGWAYYKCSNCDKISSVTGAHADGGYIELAALGHDYQVVEHMDPDEFGDGYDKYECSRCGDSYYEPIPYVPPDEPEPEDPGEGGE